ncbi:MAG: alkaline phosphatase family protein [Pseudomonadota bacterium]|nr:alkaline phosphatase family protein [Pseudomonadota bacterium]
MPLCAHPRVDLRSSCGLACSVPLLLLLGCTHPHGEEDGTPPRPDESAAPDTAPADDPVGPSILVLVIDGLRTDECTSDAVSDLAGHPGVDGMPRLWSGIAQEGVVVRRLLNTGITITAPAHAAMMVGRPEPYANFPVDDGAGQYRPVLPTLFEEARRQLGLSEDEVVLLANTSLLAGIASSVYPGEGAGAYAEEVAAGEADGGRIASDKTVLAALSARIDAGPPRVAVLNLHDVDRSGHYGESGEYPVTIRTVDADVADFWEWLHATHPEYAANVLLVVTADHGRHRIAEDEMWRFHGGGCLGCREVPLFLAGSGVTAGAELDGTFTSLDLAPTLAAHLGITLPWAEGLPLVEGIAGLDPAARSGEIARAASGSLVATQAWLDDREARSEVRADGTAISTPGALGAEAPSVLSGSAGDWACFRELTPQDDQLPWLARCLLRTEGAWSDIGFPVAEVSPFWRAALVERDGVLWSAWGENPIGAATLQEGTVGLALASWTAADGWSSATLLPAYYPSDATLVATEAGLVAAFTTNDPEPDSRHTRRVRTVSMTLGDTGPVESASSDFSLRALLGAQGRVENPVLTANGQQVRAAMVGIGSAGTLVAVVTSEDGGETWGAPVQMPDGGAPLPNLAPAWDADTLVWGALVDGGAVLCRAAVSETEARCTSVGSARLQSFTVRDDVATVVRDAGIGDWETATIRW